MKTQYRKVDEAIKAAPKKGMTRREIKKLLYRNLSGDRTTFTISKERFIGVVATLFGVLGYDPKKAHMTAERLAKCKEFIFKSK